MLNLFFRKNTINHKRNELSSTAHSNGRLCLVITGSLTFSHTSKVVTYLHGQIVCGVACRASCGSTLCVWLCTLTRLLELAVARSGTGDLERSRLASGSSNTSFSKIEGNGPSSSGVGSTRVDVNRLPSTGAVLSSAGTAVASSNSCWPLTIASGMMLCPCRIACASASASPAGLMFCAETRTGIFSHKTRTFWLSFPSWPMTRDAGDHVVLPGWLSLLKQTTSPTKYV